MKQLGFILRDHIHCLAITAVLILIMTFPTIEYVFRTDVFWLPTGKSSDVFIEIWDVWYGGQVLTGAADRFHTDALFYPEGVSLVYHPINFPYVIAVNALQSIVPLSNAFCLAYLLIIYLSALSAYVYLLFLFEDKWIALFGAVIFGCSPHVIGHPHHPNNALIATLPWAVYFFHRGLLEKRRGLTLASGIVTGLTSIINIYAYICILMTLGGGIVAFARSRWREQAFWRYLALLMLAIVVASLWRILPMLSDSQSFGAALEWTDSERNQDLISFFVNHRNPVVGPAQESVADAIFPTEGASARRFSPTSYLGYLPLLLIGIGLFDRSARRRMLPWLALALIFLVLRLGSFLSVNGMTYQDIVLPKYHLNILFPFIFEAFVETDNFIIGCLLPLAVLACYGLSALRKRLPATASRWFVLLLIALTAIEYVIPVDGNTIRGERVVYLDWLAQESGDEIRIINLPMGRGNSKHYNLYQALSGFPQAEGAISRTPDEAFAFIRGNYILSNWHSYMPATCDGGANAAYLSALDELDAAGFSHIVFHRLRPRAGEIGESFRHAAPAHNDDFVAIFRLEELRLTCA